MCVVCDEPDTAARRRHPSSAILNSLDCSPLQIFPQYRYFRVGLPVDSLHPLGYSIGDIDAAIGALLLEPFCTHLIPETEDGNLAEPTFGAFLAEAVGRTAINLGCHVPVRVLA